MSTTPVLRAWAPMWSDTEDPPQAASTDKAADTANRRDISTQGGWNKPRYGLQVLASIFHPHQRMQLLALHLGEITLVHPSDQHLLQEVDGGRGAVGMRQQNQDPRTISSSDGMPPPTMTLQPCRPLHDLFRREWLGVSLGCATLPMGHKRRCNRSECLIASCKKEAQCRDREMTEEQSHSG